MPWKICILPGYEVVGSERWMKGDWHKSYRMPRSVSKCRSVSNIYALPSNSKNFPQAFFDAHPHFAQRFPGGILQFAQMAGQLPPDVLEDLMLVEAVNANAAGGMPGGFDNMQEEEEADNGNRNGNAFEVEVNFNPQVAAVGANRQVPRAADDSDNESMPGPPRSEDNTSDEDDAEEEEEVISVSQNSSSRQLPLNPQSLC